MNDPTNDRAQRVSSDVISASECVVLVENAGPFAFAFAMLHTIRQYLALLPTRRWQTSRHCCIASLFVSVSVFGVWCVRKTPRRLQWFVVDRLVGYVREMRRWCVVSVNCVNVDQVACPLIVRSAAQGRPLSVVYLLVAWHTDTHTDGQTEWRGVVLRVCRVFSRWQDDYISTSLNNDDAPTVQLHHSQCTKAILM